MNETQKTILAWAAFIASIAVCIGVVIGYQYYQDHRTKSHTQSQQNSASTTCKDVTSYDYNWQNDVLCTRPDGSQFYTDYAGGHAADPNF